MISTKQVQVTAFSTMTGVFSDVQSKIMNMHAGGDKKKILKEQKLLQKRQKMKRNIDVMYTKYQSGPDELIDKLIDWFYELNLQKTSIIGRLAVL